MVILFLIFLTSISHLATLALKIDGVGIEGNREFMHIQTKDSDNVLVCNYTLDKEEQAKTITWYHDSHMIFKWAPPSTPEIGVELKDGDVSVSRNDGFLQFVNLRSDLAGKYRCEVTTSVGETYKSHEYQLLVVDMPTIAENVKSSVENCSVHFSWTAPPIFPKPEPKCGVWSVKYSYVSTARSFQATPFNNGSIAYRLIDEVFNIQNMPLDSLIRCELMITKIDDTSIQLMERSYHFPEVWERGCPILEVGDGVHLEYDNERLTCHSEIRSKDGSAPVTARLKCMEGYVAKYPNFASVQMICKTGDDTALSKWTFDDGLSWNDFDNLYCVKEPKTPERPPGSIKNENQEGQSGHSATYEVSSGGQSFMKPWSVLILVGVTVLSGIAWGLKNLSRKKEPRHMA